MIKPSLLTDYLHKIDTAREFGAVNSTYRARRERLAEFFEKSATNPT